MSKTASNYISLEEILGRDTEELVKVKQGEFTTEKLGVVPYSGMDHAEYKRIKKQCMKMTPNPDGSGGMIPDVDDDKLMVMVIIEGVNKDPRSTFTFANKELLDKLGVVSAEAAVGKLVAPGEVYKWAVEIQNLSGFGKKAKADQENAIKNS